MEDENYRQQIEAIYDDFTHFKFRISIRMLEIEKAIQANNSSTSVIQELAKIEHNVAMGALEIRIDEITLQNKTLAKNYLSLKAINEGLYKEVEELRAKAKPSDFWKLRNSADFAKMAAEKVQDENKELRKQLEAANEQLAGAAALKQAHQQLQDELAECKVHNGSIAKRNLKLQHDIAELKAFNETLETNAAQYRALMGDQEKLRDNLQLCQTTVFERTLEVCALQQHVADAKAKAAEREACLTKVIQGLRKMIVKRAE